MKQFRKLESLRNTANAGDNLIEGYQLIIDNEEFLVFVMNENTGTQRGYILKLMFQDGKNDSVNLSEKKNDFLT